MAAPKRFRERYYKECGSFRWEITDKYGDPLSADVIRDRTLNEVLDSTPNDLNIIYTIGVKRKSGLEQGWGLYNIIFEPRYNELKIYPLGNGEIRVTLPCKSIDECEGLVNMLCKGNQLDVQPVYLKSFKL